MTWRKKDSGLPLHHLRYVGEYSITVYFSLSFLILIILYLTNARKFSEFLGWDFAQHYTNGTRFVKSLYITAISLDSSLWTPQLWASFFFGPNQETKPGAPQKLRCYRCHYYRGTSFLAFSSVKALERSWLCIVTDFYRYILGIVPLPSQAPPGFVGFFVIL